MSWRSAIESRHGSLRGWLRGLATGAEYQLGGLRPFVGSEPRAVRRLVFVCLGNLNRSAFAAVVARRCGVPPDAVCSVGLAAPIGMAPPALTQRIASEFGADLSAHRARAFSDLEPEPGDLLLAMEARHARALVERGVPPQAIALLGQWAAPPRLHVHDPQGLSEAWCRSCFGVLNSATVRLVDRLKARGNDGWRR